MAYEPREGDVTIFKNDTDNERAPQYKGYAIIDGEKRQIALWVKEGAKGKFFSGTVELTPRQQQGQQPAQRAAAPQAPAPIRQSAGATAPPDDDLPF